MIYRKYFFFIFLISVLSCKSRLNQIVNHQREGKWVTIDTLDFIYITKGKYHKGLEIGTWKQFCNGKISKKEKYYKEFSSIKYYYPNGKIMKRGYVKLDSNASEEHWYYFGKWYYFNEKGKLDSIKTYQKEDTTDDIIIPSEKNQ